MLSKVTDMLHFAGKESVLAWVGKMMKEAQLTCAKGPALGLVGFGMDMPNAISSMAGCDKGDGYCIAKELMGGFLSPVMDLAMDMYNIEQDCGYPFLQGLQDCEGDDPPDQGYFNATPRDKNFPTFVTRSISTVLAGIAGVMGSVATCEAKNGSKQEPMHPLALVPLPVIQAGFSFYEFTKLREFLKLPEAKGFAGACETASATSALFSDVSGFVTAVLDLVSHNKYDEKTKPNAGWKELCASEILGAIDALPAFLDVICSYQSCKDGFPKAALRQHMYGGETEDTKDDK